MNTDEGFREIQLNGKQLIFLFMATTVVGVVIFLLGVLVGRGVRPERPAQAETTSAAVVPDAAPVQSSQPAFAPALSARYSTRASSRSVSLRYRLREDRARPSASRTVGTGTMSTSMSRSQTISRISVSCW